MHALYPAIFLNEESRNGKRGRESALMPVGGWHVFALYRAMIRAK
jgi:hypothetical protein